jgi:phosphinothricin acetyltransferase
MEAIAVRFASLEDAAAICAIYNQGIEDRLATLETELRDPDERRRWLRSRGPRHPVVVAESGTQLVAWASLNSFNPRQCYDYVADISVYVERSWRGKGVGRILLAHLLELGRSVGFHKLVLACFPTNKPGVALYERMGFVPVGVYQEQGLLDGQWVDVLIMEHLL